MMTWSFTESQTRMAGLRASALSIMAAQVLLGISVQPLLHRFRARIQSWGRGKRMCILGVPGVVNLRSYGRDSRNLER